MKQVLSGLLFGLMYSVTSGKGYDIRKDELSRMNKYELVDMDITWNSGEDSSIANTLSFNAFDQDFKLSLFLNDKLVPSKIKHTNGIPEEASGHFINNEQSCHYRVSSSKSLPLSSNIHGGVGLCEKFGVRARILTNDETYIIRPANYYLDLEFDSSLDQFHDFSHKHLIYRMSDYNRTGIPTFGEENHVKHVKGDTSGFEAHRKDILQGKHGHKGFDMRKVRNNMPQAPPKRDNSGKTSVATVDETVESPSYKDDDNGRLSGNYNGGNRRLLQYNSGNNQVELYVMIDPQRYSDFYDDYGSNWYDTLVEDTFSYVNDMSDTYEETEWGNTVGDISVSLVELEVVQAYTGDYASLQTDCSCGSGGCTDAYGSCSITGGSPGQLADFTTWLGYYKDTSTFDNAQLWTNENLEGSAGTGWLGTVCSGSYSSNNDQLTYGYDWGVRTITHELGHNFDCSHDQDTSCGVDAGLMGYGSGEGFSACSITYVQDYFDEKSGLSCLGDGVRSFTSNFGDGSTTNGGDDDDDDDDTTTGTTGDDDDDTTTGTTDTDTGGDDDDDTTEDCSEYDSVCPDNMGSLVYGSYSYDLDGHEFTYQGCYNGYAYYSANVDGSEWYIYRSSYDYIHINNQLSNGAWAYCYASTSFSGCDGEWNLYQDGWTQDSDMTVNDDNCDDSSTTYTDTGDDDDDTGDDDDDCNGYSCIYLWGMDPADGNDFDGWWYPSGCHNDEVYYTATINGNTFYLYLSATYNYWFIYDSLYDTWADAFCFYDDLTSCCGNWYIYNSGWQSQTSSLVYYCSGMVDVAGFIPGGDETGDSSTSSSLGEYSLSFDLTYNCTNPYGDSVCLYNSGNLWEAGIGTFDYIACKEDYPFFAYRYLESNYSLIYYLSYHEQSGWLITEASIMDTTGLALCQDSDLTACTYETWYYNEVYGDSYTDGSSEMGIDIADWEVDVSMGYDANCYSEDIVTDDSAYCSTEDACAQWSFTLMVEDDTNTLDLCSDDYAGCYTMSLDSAWSDVSSDLTCHSTNKVTLDINVTFANTYGALIFYSYSEDYASIIENCDDSEDLTVTFEDSTIHVCDACDGFLSQTDTDNSGDDDDNQTEGSGANMMTTGIVMGMVVAAIAKML